MVKQGRDSVVKLFSSPHTVSVPHTEATFTVYSVSAARPVRV